MIKLRSDSSLADLTADQQAQVYEWIQTLGYTRTLEKLAAPSPDGLALKTHRASLHAFFVQYRKQIKQQHLADAAELAAQSQSTSAFRLGAENAAHHAAFELSTTPLDPENFTKLGRWLIRQKALEQKAEFVRIAQEHLALARDRLVFDREKFQFNTARAAIALHAQIAKIVGNRKLDGEDKVRAARDLLFGPFPSHIPKPGDGHENTPFLAGAPNNENQKTDS